MFDFTEDPHEMTNLYNHLEHANVQVQLLNKLKQLKQHYKVVSAWPSD